MSKRFFLLLILVLFLAMGVVSAAQNITSDGAMQAVDDDEVLSSPDSSDEILSAHESDVIGAGSNYADIDGGDDGNDFSDYVVLKASNVKKSYSKSKTFSVKAVSKADTKFGVEGVKLKLRIYDKGSHKDYYRYTNYYGVAKFKLPKLSVGEYKMTIYPKDSWFKGEKISRTLKVTPSKAKVTAPEFKGTYKHSDRFHAKLIDSETNKPIKKIKVLVRVASKKLVLKSDSKGVVKFKTKYFKAGYYSVVIASKNKNYKFKAKSSIEIRPLKTIVKAKLFKKSKTFKIKIQDRINKKPVKRVKVTVWFGAKKRIRLTDGNGLLRFGTKHMRVGNHPVHIITHNRNYAIDHRTVFKIHPLKTVVKAKLFKKSKKFKIKVRDKSTKESVKRLKLAVWIDGKKRIYRTDGKGLASFSTKNMDAGVHHVHIKSASPKYSVSHKCIFKIKKISNSRKIFYR